MKTFDPGKQEINAAAKRLANEWRKANPGQDCKLVRILESGLKND